MALLIVESHTMACRFGCSCPIGTQNAYIYICMSHKTPEKVKKSYRKTNDLLSVLKKNREVRVAKEIQIHKSKTN